MQVQPYLFFEGRCEEALSFYATAIGAEVVTKMRYKDSPDPAMCSAGTADKIMHASFRVGETTLMASDGGCEGNPTFHGFALSITVSAEADAEKLFNALAAGGKVTMPLTKTFFAKSFGMVADKFGMGWMILAM